MRLDKPNVAIVFPKNRLTPLQVSTEHMMKADFTKAHDRLWESYFVALAELETTGKCEALNNVEIEEEVTEDY